MQFALSEDQRAIQETVRAWLDDAVTIETRKAALESALGWDEGLWSGFGADMGLVGLMVPERYGGSGLGAVEMALVLEQTGRVLAPAPFFETAVLAVQTLSRVANEAQQAALLPGLASGARTATVAVPVPGGALPRLQGRGQGFILDGRAGHVTFAHVADLILLAARHDDGVSLIALSGNTPGVTVTRHIGLDPTRPFATLQLDAVEIGPDQILGVAGGAAPAFAGAIMVSAGLLAAEQTGGAAYCLSSTVDYAGQRVQFGRTIGSFQAVKHTLADMMVQVEAARSAFLYAASAIDGDVELQEACAVAKAWCSDAYRFCAGEAIQLHGGIGFTWEHPAHLYFKRAHSSSAWLGDPSTHRETLAGLIGLDDPDKDAA